jgi:hypothetical protein
MRSGLRFRVSSNGLQFRPVALNVGLFRTPLLQFVALHVWPVTLFRLVPQVWPVTLQFRLVTHQVWPITRQFRLVLQVWPFHIPHVAFLTVWGLSCCFCSLLLTEGPSAIVL